MFLIVAGAIFTANYSSAKGANNMCDAYTPSSVQISVENSVDLKVTTFANSKVIASKADTMLSKLITAKSPIILNWLKKRNIGDESEVNIAKAWRDYFAKNFILSKYPQGSPDVDSETEALVDGILKENFKTIFVERMENLFTRAKKGALLFVSTMPSSQTAQKKQIIERINSIQLYWPKSLKTSRNNAIPLDLIAWGIAYDPTSNDINIGLRALFYPNDETYLAVFAHEIGHSIDSCRWGAYFDGKWPFEKVGECLRSEKSIQAKKRDDSNLEKIAKESHLSSELVTALKQNPTCNKMDFPPIGTQADQLPESFADWFSAEVVARIEKLDINHLRMDLCEQKVLNEGSSYPSNQARLNFIYFVQPKLKAALKMSKPNHSEATYCKF
jgi:hypothetical protein